MASINTSVLNGEQYTLGKTELIENKVKCETIKTNIEIKNNEIFLEKIQELNKLVDEMNSIVNEINSIVSGLELQVELK